MGLLEYDPRDVAVAPSTTSDGGSTDSPEATVHVHRPGLEADGSVEWDRSTDAVATGQAFEEGRPLLESHADDGAEPPAGRV